MHLSTILLHAISSATPSAGHVHEAYIPGHAAPIDLNPHEVAIFVCLLAYRLQAWPLTHCQYEAATASPIHSSFLTLACTVEEVVCSTMASLHFPRTRTTEMRLGETHH